VPLPAEGGVPMATASAVRNRALRPGRAAPARTLPPVRLACWTSGPRFVGASPEPKPARVSRRASGRRARYRLVIAPCYACRAN
jgi:hypothetical protein